MIRGPARMLAAVVLVALAVPGQAAADRSFTATGSLTYTWQGDPARGCAQVGVCGVQGALTLGAAGGSSISGGGRVGRLIDVPIDTSGATVRVADGPGAGDCIDQPSDQSGPADILITREGGRLVARISGLLASGRCAGPTQADLAAVVLPVSRRGGKRVMTYDLRGSQDFAAGPFAGRLVSTIMIRSTRGGGGSGAATSGPVPRPPPTHKVLLEQVTLRYRLASLPGNSLDVAFSGEPDPFCAALDSCGASGTLGLGLSGFAQSLVIQASRPVAKRTDARQVLADLRRWRLRPFGEFSLVGKGASADVTETFAQPAGLGCQDASTARVSLFLSVAPGRSARSAALALREAGQSDVFRTHCPGPNQADVFGTGSSAIARASIGTTQLAARHSVVTFALTGGFAGAGYVGTRSGALRFSLSLEHVHAGTVEVMRP